MAHPKNPSGNPAWEPGIVQFSSRYLPEWQQNLIEKFPEIYSVPNPKILDVYKDQKCEGNMDTEFFCNLRHGFEFSEGWSEIVEKFSEITTQFVFALQDSGIQRDAYVRSFIFKEKFGCLTWQGDDNLNEPFRTVFHGYIRSVENSSRFTCEKTGKHGMTRNIGGYIVTLCDEEYEKLCKERKERLHEIRPI